MIHQTMIRLWILNEYDIIYSFFQGNVMFTIRVKSIFAFRQEFHQTKTIVMHIN